MACRGYKVVVKFFPNEAANLEPVVDMLLKLEEQVVWCWPPLPCPLSPPSPLPTPGLQKDYHQSAFCVTIRFLRIMLNGLFFSVLFSSLDVAINFHAANIEKPFWVINCCWQLFVEVSCLLPSPLVSYSTV